jgi:hypothetical protein
MPRNRSMMQAERRALRPAWRLAMATALVFALGSWQARPARAEESPRGDLKIEGTHISRILLDGGEGEAHTEELTDPCGTVKVPVGTYRVQRVELRGGYMSLSGGTGELKRIAITEDIPEVLKLGGPLRQEVQATRQGRLLILNYKLLGIGGEAYRSTSSGRPPRFTVYKGDRAIGSGQLEYG